MNEATDEDHTQNALAQGPQQMNNNKNNEATEKRNAFDVSNNAAQAVSGYCGDDKKATIAVNAIALELNEAVALDTSTESSSQEVDVLSISSDAAVAAPANKMNRQVSALGTELLKEKVEDLAQAAAPAPAPPIKKHEDRNAQMLALRTWEDRTRYARMSYEERRSYRETYHRQRTQRRRSSMRRKVTPSVVSYESGEKKGEVAAKAGL
jgi:hypothetical protein